MKKNTVLLFDESPSQLPFSKRRVKNRLGYDVELFSADGEFKSVVIVPDDTTEFVYLKTTGFNQLNEELKDILRSYVRFILERYHAGTVQEKFSFLSRFVSEINLGHSPDNVLTGLTLEKDKNKRARLISSAKEFLEFLVLHEYGDISFKVYEEFNNLRSYTDRSNSYSALFLMDENHGPFTREELSLLSAEVDNEKHSLPLRLLLDLCLSYGLRPIQISLLKRKDFIRDSKTGLCYLNIPRVKNCTRNRRSQFGVRILQDRTANIIDRYIESVDIELGGAKSGDLPIFISTQPVNLERTGNVKGRKHWRDESRRSKDYYEDTAKQSYVYHKRVSSLKNMLAYAEINFPLSPRTGQRFNLHPYRFRYTVGTQAVMSGCTPEEVADLLDHSNTLCVKHYFRFTREMWEILEQATHRRIEQQHFTAAWMREDDLKGNIYARIVYESRGFTAIGKCATESACFEEPAVACYSCKRFCPNKKATAHLNALENLTQRKEKLLLASTNNVVSVIDQSIAGCYAAIAYAEGKDVTFINVKEV
ncbi:site-specific integrase [Pseudomonas frederiksbergensis]|uniref:site-specific integrase n=1 Tax=Pseudomonas frederiksbergensis TaxID=104087 RepID=UPI003D1A15BB